LNLAQSLLGQLKTFQFRATAPLFDFETVAFCAKPDAKGVILWARGPDGRMCLSASAT
jgi:3-methylfumaryl-CoA hydratase